MTERHPDAAAMTMVSVARSFYMAQRFLKLMEVDFLSLHTPQSASLGKKLGLEPRMGVNVPVWMTASILFKADWS